MSRQSGIILVPILLILAIVLSLGIAYYMFNNGDFLKNPESANRVLSKEEVQEIVSQSQSDEVTAIEQDLEVTSFTSIDSDLQNLEEELNGALQE